MQTHTYPQHGTLLYWINWFLLIMASCDTSQNVFKSIISVLLAWISPLSFLEFLRPLSVCFCWTKWLIDSVQSFFMIHDLRLSLNIVLQKNAKLSLSAFRPKERVLHRAVKFNYRLRFCSLFCLVSFLFPFKGPILSYTLIFSLHARVCSFILLGACRNEENHFGTDN